MPQLSLSGRVVQLVAVSQGRVFFANSGDTAWTEATNNTANTPPLNFSGLMFSAANNQKLWFADGSNWCVYVPATSSVETWKATAGTLPVDSDGNLPRLIATWRGRTVLSGLLKDPQNIFMSAVFDPTDFDYSPVSTSSTQAIALNLSPLGLIGDVVTALVPYNDDMLVVGGDHTVWIVRGDPMAGGQIDRISDAIGFAWGEAWCRAPSGELYFFSNKTGIYSLLPTQWPRAVPVRISQAIEQLLVNIDTGQNSIRLIWDDRFQGFHVFVTALVQPTMTTHFFYEQRTGAWWTDQFANTDFDPLCCVTFDGNLPGDRVPLIGSWDGVVRAISATATDDDGFPIQSSVMIGPLVTKELDEIMAYELQGVLGEGASPVTFAVYVGTTAEKALGTVPVVTGTFQAGRNFTEPVRRSGHALWLKLSCSSPWSMEEIRIRLSTLGKVRRRGKS